mmetsp:Transcript_13481/g.24138  ORF Transcript_13481/g.24138 Transcript_13481/m.24138 type:complete len:649 (+) Transcript_13481:109-2055(+)
MGMVKNGKVSGRVAMFTFICLVCIIYVYDLLLMTFTIREDFVHAHVPRARLELVLQPSQLEGNVGVAQQGGTKGDLYVKPAKVDSVIKPNKAMRKKFTQAQLFEVDSEFERDLATVTAHQDVLRKRISRLARGDLSGDESKARAFLKSRLECDETSSFMVIRPVSDGGVGLVLNQYLLLINTALAMGKVPVIDGKDLLWFEGKTISIFDLFDLPCKRPNGELMEEATRSISCNVSCDRRDIYYSSWIPEKFSHRPMLWWWQQLSTFVFKPSLSLLKKLHNLPVLKASPIYNPAPPSSALGFSSLFDLQKLPRPWVSLHLRHGDSCSPDRPRCIGSAEDAFEIMRDKNITHGTIFLATDSSSLVEEVKGLMRSRDSGFKGRVVSFNIDRGFYQKFFMKDLAYEEDGKLKKLLKRTTIGLEAVLDIALLSQGEIHVGSFYSNFIRLALNVAQRNPLGKYVSFDAEWCPYEICSLGWLTSVKCPLWEKHLCQWRPMEKCNIEAIPRCTQFAGTLCSDRCLIFYIVKDGWDSARLPSDIVKNMAPMYERVLEATARNPVVSCETKVLKKGIKRGPEDKQWNVIRSWQQLVLDFFNPLRRTKSYSSERGFTDQVIVEGNDFGSYKGNEQISQQIPRLFRQLSRRQRRKANLLN